MAYDIQYASQAVENIRALQAFDRAAVVNAIEQYLTHEPEKVSKSRIKRMIQPFWSDYRLRVDDFRIYYDVDSAAQKVNILRVLWKGTGQTQPEAT